MRWPGRRRANSPPAELDETFVLLPGTDITLGEAGLAFAERDRAAAEIADAVAAVQHPQPERRATFMGGVLLGVALGRLREFPDKIPTLPKEPPRTLTNGT